MPQRSAATGMPKISRLVAALGFFAACAIASTPANIDPATVVRQFYEWRLHSGMGGSPDAAQLAAMRGWLTAELACLLQAARKFDDVTLATQPDIKPLYAEGDLLSGAFGTPDRFKIEATQIQGDGASVRVRFYPGAEFGGESWPVMVHLRKKAAEWAISDVQYPAKFVIGNPVLTNVRLTKTLYNVLAHDGPDGWKASNALACRQK